MRKSQTDGLAESNRTWICVANRSTAQILQSDGGVKNLRAVDTLAFPEGRRKNREIERDRAAGGKSTVGGSGTSPHGGLVNKGEGHFHLTQIFARQLAERLGKARAENAFEKLVLVAEPRFLGELRASLDPVTMKSVTLTVDKTLVALELPELKDRLAELITFRAPG